MHQPDAGKPAIKDIDRSHIPADNRTDEVDQQTQYPTDDPALVGYSSLAQNGRMN